MIGPRLVPLVSDPGWTMMAAWLTGRLEGKVEEAGLMSITINPYLSMAVTVSNSVWRVVSGVAHRQVEGEVEEAGVHVQDVVQHHGALPSSSGAVSGVISLRGLHMLSLGAGSGTSDGASHVTTT
jgi:hypothetical protein